MKSNKFSAQLLIEIDPTASSKYWLIASKKQIPQRQTSLGSNRSGKYGHATFASFAARLLILDEYFARSAVFRYLMPASRRFVEAK